jgi:hypothetical protein
LIAQYGFGKCYFSSLKRLKTSIERWKADFVGILDAKRPTFNNIADTESPWMAEGCRRLQARTIRYVIDLAEKVVRNQVIPHASRMALLLELIWTLIQFADSLFMTQQLHQRFDFLLTRTLSNGLPNLDLHTMTVSSTVSRARRDVMSSWYPAELINSDAEICELLINFFRVFFYLELKGRLQVIDLLSHWLTATDASQDGPSLTKSDLVDMEDQIIRTWRRTRHDPEQW